MTQHPSLHFHLTGTLTARDAKRHVMHPFTVPAGVRRLSIDFACIPAATQGLDNMLTLTIFDPHGFRGARHRGGSRHTVQIAEDAATPGYLAGPLPAGEWVVQIDTHRIMPGAPVHYTIEIAMSTAPDRAAHHSHVPEALQRRTRCARPAGIAVTCTATPITPMRARVPWLTSLPPPRAPAWTSSSSPTTIRHPASLRWKRWMPAICSWPGAWS